MLSREEKAFFFFFLLLYLRPLRIASCLLGLKGKAVKVTPDCLILVHMPVF